MPKRSLNRYFVYIPDEQCYGITESMGAYASLVKFNRGGVEHKIMILNEDLVFLEEFNISLEEEEL